MFGGGASRDLRLSNDPTCSCCGILHIINFTSSKNVFSIYSGIVFPLSKISVRACDTSMASAGRPEGEAFVSGQEFGAAEALPA